jgi:hypothetical protein
MNVLHAILSTCLGSFFTVSTYDNDGKILTLTLHKINDDSIVESAEDMDMDNLSGLVTNLESLISKMKAAE